MSHDLQESLSGKIINQNVPLVFRSFVLNWNPSGATPLKFPGQDSTFASFDIQKDIILNIDGF